MLHNTHFQQSLAHSVLTKTFYKQGLHPILTCRSPLQKYNALLGRGKIQILLGSSVPSTTPLYKWMNRPVVLHCSYFSRNAYKPKNTLFLTLTGPDPLYPSHLYFKFFYDSAKRCVIPNHSEIAFTFVLDTPSLASA
jgi:hypothetical protein